MNDGYLEAYTDIDNIQRRLSQVGNVSTKFYAKLQP
jgi:hypothetical protein